ncbi:amidase family protein [Microbacterium sp. 2FI]|uniref:amidase family protein n=1 Tax=Microbacterium sp. 2FI TaxID=2502193 RepID=UPI0010F964B2|nr:amidase family protein [Microbacterium sp. 2FI]
MLPDPLASATELAEGLRTGGYTSTELTEAAIARIEEMDAAVNAVVVRDFIRARQEAAAADAALARGEQRRLLGIPITVKESFDLRGHATTWGVEEFRGHRADRDALPVRRLTDAGAVLLGKTNVPVWLDDWQSDNPVYGRTRNPYDLSRTPGGSSGGSAVAVALGFSALELGSDIGGSVRVPAAFCGVFGHKPTWGLLASDGHSPAGMIGEPPPLAVIGPLARTAEDLDLALRILAGRDDLAPGGWAELPAPRHARLADYRVLVLDAHPAARTQQIVRDAVQDAAARAAAAGASVSRASELLPDLARAYDDYRAMLAAVGSRRSPVTEASMPVQEWFALLDRQRIVRRQWSALFEEFDVVLAPVYGTVAFPLSDEPDNERRQLEIDGSLEPYDTQLAWPSIATFANLPATAAPVGVTAGGLPLSVQVIGPHRGDRTTIAFAGLIARETAPPPGA